MPLELLREIATHKMPFTLKDRDQVDKLRELRAAGHVMAFTSPPTAAQPFANVLTLTRQGMNALQVAQGQGVAAHPWKK
jgi:hypothetical protein